MLIGIYYLRQRALARGGESRGQRNRIPGCARPQRAATLISTGFLRDASALAYKCVCHILQHFSADTSRHFCEAISNAHTQARFIALQSVASCELYVFIALITRLLTSLIFSVDNLIIR